MCLFPSDLTVDGWMMERVTACLLASWAVWFIGNFQESKKVKLLKKRGPSVAPSCGDAGTLKPSRRPIDMGRGGSPLDEPKARSCMNGVSGAVDRRRPNTCSAVHSKKSIVVSRHRQLKKDWHFLDINTQKIIAHSCASQQLGVILEEWMISSNTKS